MPRTSVSCSGLLLIVASALGCGNVVPLSEVRYTPLLPSVDVQVIDARGMTREQLERILEEHEVIGRFDARPRSGDRYESDLADALEKGKERARVAGGSVLMYTDDSELIAIIARDARFAGAPETVTMYVMRPKGG